MAIDASFPAPLECLFKPKRYKVLWGGRSAGRSWGCARALLLIGTERAIRVLCVRELQNSIGESVHKLLADQIEAMGLSAFYEIQVAKIIGKNGTTFSFEGIKNNTSKIKSYEGIDYCWVEEANKVSRASWQTLIPTIRKPQSEIWITFNPELETDYTYQRFVRDADPELAFTIKMTWRDNPWLPDVMLSEMEDLKRRDYDSYLNVWEGYPLQLLEGAVYAKELRRALEENRITRVPWDHETPVDTFWDLGRADRTTIWFAQRVAMEYRVLAYYESSGEDIIHYVKECQKREYTYGTMFLPHDAKAKRLGSKRTIEEQLRSAFPSVSIVPKLSVTDGINAARVLFPQLWFDGTQCADGLDRLRHYHYRVVDGHLSNDPVHDEASDAADSFRYMAVALRGPRPNKAEGLLAKLGLGRASAPESVGRGGSPGGLGWMA